MSGCPAIGSRLRDLESGVVGDHHSCIFVVEEGEEITVLSARQMVVFGAVFVNDGVLNIDGIMLVEP